MSDKAVVVPANLAELPLPVPDVMMGLPLNDEAGLTVEQERAAKALYDLASPHLFDSIPVTAERYVAIAEAYARAKALGLGDYCPIIQIGAAFELDDDARAVVAMAKMGLGCYGCHGMF